MSRVLVFDTTLRDGEQSPGASLTSHEKLEIARALARLGVDVIEAGFPAASADDFEAVRRIAREVGGGETRVCGLARARRGDIERAWEAIRDAARPRIHTFLATSPIHREHKLGMTKAEVLAAVREMVAFARERCEDVEFSAEDACRTEPGFLCEVFTAALEAGASTLNVPDTVGYTTPLEMDRRVRTIRANVPGIEAATISVHCHDDLGMATANTLAAVGAGARQVEVTLNGIGERAGNTALEEVVMALRTRPRFFGLETGVDATQIYAASRLVSTLTGMPVQPNKAIVGANAFAHEAGIHQDGVLKHGATYEIMRPEAVGVPESLLVLGKHSGRHALRVRLEELGHPVEGEALDEVFGRFKALADRKKHVTDADLLALVSAAATEDGALTLDSIQVSCGTMGMPTATVRLRDADGVVRVHAAVGSGPVDATFQAIDAIAAVSPRLLEYRVQAVTAGIDALGEVSVRIAHAEDAPSVSAQHGARRRVHHGHGADTDVVVASAHAYLNALNRLMAAEPAAASRRKAS
ncbi:MAG: 2-isopropylmalate synthase [Myxococcota bacterium]|nr:2-isopropylmalate synthase [Myxococcota bacterium]